MTGAAKGHGPFAGLFVVGLGASLAAMDLAVNVAFPAITAAFALEARAIRWLVVSYVLTYASLMLAFGNLGDHIGHRRVFRAGLIVSAAAFVLCALAPDYAWLLVARIAQGIGTALVLSCAPALATLLFDEGKRTQALGAYSSAVSVASILAPLVGGVSIAMLGWSGVFWFRAPIALLALLLLPRLTAPQPAKVGPLHTFALRGPLLIAAGIASLLLSTSLIHSNASTSIAVLLALVAVGFLGAFALHQQRAAEPMLPRATIRDPEFVLPNVASVAVHFVAFAVPLLLPYHLARIGGYSPAAVGAVIALSPVGMLLGSMVAVPIARIAGPRRAALLGAILVATGSLAIALWAAATSLAPLAMCLLVNGMGVGLFQVAYMDVIVAALPRHARGVAGSLTMVTRTVGVVTAATVLTGAMQAMERRHRAAGQSETEAFASAFDAVFLYAAAMLAALLLLSCLRRRLWFTS